MEVEGESKLSIRGSFPDGSRVFCSRKLGVFLCFFLEGGSPNFTE